MNAFDISPKTAKSIVEAYFPHEAIRYNRQDSCPLDGMLIARAASALGFDRTYNLLKDDTKTKIQIDGMASDIANILQQLKELKSAVAAKESLVDKTPLISSPSHAPPARHLLLPASSSDSILASSTEPVQVYHVALVPFSEVHNAQAYVRNPLPAFKPPPPSVPPTSLKHPENNTSKKVLGDLFFWN